MKHWKDKYFRHLTGILAFLYLVGVVGLHTRYGNLFLATTPALLILTAALLFLYHRIWNGTFILFMVVTFLAGYLVEVAGVHTGIIFGEYQYGKTLGPKLFSVPPMIGLNWLVLIYAVGTMVQPIKGNWLMKSILGGLLMILMDLPLEPVATRLDFWAWEQVHVPVQNYLGWYIVSVVLLGLYHRWVDYRQNRMALWIYLIQFVFFILVFLTGKGV